MSTPSGADRNPPGPASDSLAAAAGGHPKPESAIDFAASTVGKADERKAVKWIVLAAIIILVATLLIWIVPSIAYALNGYQPLIPPANTNVSANYHLITVTVTITVSLGMFMGILGFLFLYLGFSALKEGDERFIWPSIMALFGIPAVILFGASVALLSPQLQPLIDCISLSGLKSQCYSAIGSYVSGYYLLIWGGVILYVIGGLGAIIGLVRYGSFYRLRIFWVGGVLLIFPALCFLGAILVLVGTVQARKKIEHRAPTAWDG